MKDAFKSYWRQQVEAAKDPWFWFIFTLILIVLLVIHITWK